MLKPILWTIAESDLVGGGLIRLSMIDLCDNEITTAQIQTVNSVYGQTKSGSWLRFVLFASPLSIYATAIHNRPSAVSEIQFLVGLKLM